MSVLQEEAVQGKLEMPKLTKRYVDSIQPDLGKPIKSWDAELRGFGLVTYPSGRKTYCVEYRNSERIKKRLKIGVHGQVSAEMAREKARQLLGKVSQGEDPADTKKSLRHKPKVVDLCNDYLSGHATKKRVKSLSEDKRYIDNFILPSFSHRMVDSITQRDLEQLHTRLSKTPYQANRILALLSKLFSLAIAWGWCNDNPSQGIQRYQEEKRDRWLDEEELKHFWAVLDKYPKNTTALLLKFLLLTGARKGEAMNATWEHIDLNQGVWTKPSHMTKQKKKEYLPLSCEAIEILEILRKENASKSCYVFPGNVDGQPLKEIKKFWKKILLEADIENFRIHDLRHTHASHLVSSGLSLSIVGKLLGHTQAATTQRYAHLGDKTLRQAAELFGRKVGQGL